MSALILNGMWAYNLILQGSDHFLSHDIKSRFKKYWLTIEGKTDSDKQPVNEP